jgi:alpha-tubulin suppressor-like RCC1 family protein
VDLNRYFRPAVFIFLLAAVPAFADSHLGGCPGLTVQLRPDGTVWCAGSDNHGQLGDGAIGGSSSVPVQVVGLNAIKAISVGDNYVMALDASGVLWAWGADAALVLGSGASGDSGTPVAITGLPPIRFVSAGHAHVLAIDQNGAVWTWGTASAGEMGPGVTATATPVQVTIPATPAAVKEVAAGYDFSLALLGTGTMMAWGNGSNGALGGSLSSTSTPTAWPASPAYNISHIAAFKQSLALQANGTVLSWGYGGAYGTGLGSNSNVSAATVIPGMAHIKEVVTMGDNSGAIDSGGQLWLWGNNAGGSLGLGITGAVQAPTATGINGMTSLGGASDHVIASGPSWGILGSGSNGNGQLAMGSTVSTVGWEYSFLADTNGYSAVAAGNGFTLALYKDGSVHSVGRNDVGELGMGTSGGSTIADAKIPSLNNIIALAAGDRFALALRADQTVWSWGNDDYGQLGNGNTMDAASPVPVPGLTGITMVAAGADHAVAVSNTGAVFVWGRSNHYQLGLGSLNEVTSPTQLTGFTGTPLAVSASGDHTLLLTTTGLYSFGSNGAGECGQGSTTDIQAPTLISGLSNIAQVAAGRYHSMVLTCAGQILAFGDDSAGELGDGANTNQSTPETVLLPSSFNFPPSSIAAGNNTSFVEDAFGDILATGLNANGQLGLSNSNANTSTFTPAGYGFQVAAGYNHTVLLYPGYLSLAGDNTYGELDNGSTISTAYFAESGFQNPPTSESYVGLAAGSYHSLAIDEQGNLYGWGSDAYSDLGDGKTTTQLTPTLTASGLDLIQVSAGYQYSMGIDAYGRLWGWGYSSLGAAGTGSNKGGKVPQLINFTGAVQVSCGYDHTLVLRDDGSVWGFGDDTDQCLSSAAGSPDQLTPIQIPGFSNITAVSAGQWFSMALGSNGQVYGLGTGTSGQLGRGAWTNTGTVVTADTNLVGVMGINSQ